MTRKRSLCGTRDLVIATQNAAKAREIQHILSGLGLRWRSVQEFGGLSEPVESGRTFADNARSKALYYAERTRCWALADDSGLEVDALGGRPGVHSARYAGEHKSDADNNDRLLRELGDVAANRRTARFRCAVAVAEPGRVIVEGFGTVEGLIVHEPRGTNGFGYDPVFLVPELGRTTAEMTAEEKARVSHRGRALRAVAERLRVLCSQGPGPDPAPGGPEGGWGSCGLREADGEI